MNVSNGYAVLISMIYSPTPSLTHSLTHPLASSLLVVWPFFFLRPAEKNKTNKYKASKITRLVLLPVNNLCIYGYIMFRIIIKKKEKRKTKIPWKKSINLSN
jgi:hypothetical protein